MARSTICADTGNGATITFASGITATLKVRSIDFSEESLGKIECSDLLTTGDKKYVKEDLGEPSELSVEFLWDTFDVPPTKGLDLGVVTVTYPTRTGETTPATRAGSAYVSSIKHPKLANGELQMGMLKVQFDGVTALTYTKST
jgi:hypothetical protein